MPDEFHRWTERVAAAGGLSWRIRYVRKSTENSERQVASHDQQIAAMDQKWGVVDPIWYWRDSASGTSFDRPAYKDLLDFCMQNRAKKSQARELSSTIRVASHECLMQTASRT
jgi:hypothetical protein